ncbi:alpha/beta hydrolase [Alphaproteobacteria bacterium endosymbiont of Tiliacea citrago]|uniref:alpha/beta hydrolase n=1 Tax=Alphaproteobacteria bacterium endosymbiont of Tiliacea citrago TaxID=3077944 RepID=UPI00313C37FF
MYYNNYSQRKHDVMLESPYGLLEGVFYQVKNLQDKLALILPPDPNHKGTMNNKIVNMLFNAFESNGFTTLKINYRGVGKSQGRSLNNEDKITDALISLDWLIKKCESNEIPHPQICLAGFSLGGWIALQSAMRRPEIDNFITINTLLDPSSFNMLTPCPSGLIVQAEKDVISKADIAKRFHSQLISQKGCVIDYKIIDDDHYFSNQFDDLKTKINMYIKSISFKTSKNLF